MRGQQLIKLNEQWVEKDGHMYKAVKKGSCDQNICSWAGLHVDKGLVVIDLGTVNEQGFLKEERSGKYPDICESDGIFEAYVTLVSPNLTAVLIRVQASSMQKLKNAWNWRSL